jgi:hypothetical protein
MAYEGHSMYWGEQKLIQFWWRILEEPFEARE